VSAPTLELMLPQTQPMPLPLDWVPIAGIAKSAIVVTLTRDRASTDLVSVWHVLVVNGVVQKAPQLLPLDAPRYRLAGKRLWLTAKRGTDVLAQVVVQVAG
jgi:hypothetical protein